MGRQSRLRSGLWRPPLKRVIQRHVQDPLAEQILAGRIKDGDTVRISVRDGELVLNGEPVRVAA